MPTLPSPRRGAERPDPGKLRASERAPTARDAAPRGSVWILMLAVGALAAGAVLLTALPASLAARFLPAAVQAKDFSGSVWHGSADRLTIRGRPGGALEWRLHPLEMLHMHINADVHWVNQGFVLDGTVIASRGQLTVLSVQGGGPIEDLGDLGVPAGWSGLAQVQVSEAKLQWAGATAMLRSAVGDISVANLQVRQLAEGAELGGYTLHFANTALAADGEAGADLKDTGGPLALEATIRLVLAERRGTLSGTVRVRPGAPPAVQRFVDDFAQLHARDAEGRLPVDAEFTL